MPKRDCGSAERGEVLASAPRVRSSSSEPSELSELTMKNFFRWGTSRVELARGRAAVEGWESKPWVVIADPVLAQGAAMADDALKVDEGTAGIEVVGRRAVADAVGEGEERGLAASQGKPTESFDGVRGFDPCEEEADDAADEDVALLD